MEVWLHAEGDYLGAFPICGDFSAAATRRAKVIVLGNLL